MIAFGWRVDSGLVASVAAAAACRYVSGEFMNVRCVVAVLMVDAGVLES